MAAIIKKEDILESAEIQKALKELLDMLNKVAEAGKSAGKSLSLSEISKEAEENAKATDELKKAKAELKKVMDKLAAVYSAENMALVAAQETLKKSNKIVSEAITGKEKLAKAAKDELAAQKLKAAEDKKEAERIRLRIKYNQENTDVIKIATAAIKMHANEMKNINVLTNEGKEKYAKLNLIIKEHEQRIIKATQAIKDQAAEERKVLSLKNLNEKQQLKRTKLDSTVNQYDYNTIDRVNAQIKLAEYDKSILPKNDRELIDRESAFIKRLNDEKKKLIATNRELAESEKKAAKEKAIADKQAATANRLLITAQNAQRGTAQQLVAVNAILANRMKQLNVLTVEGAAKYRQLDAAMQRNKARIVEMNHATQQQGGMFKNLAQSIITYGAAYLSVQSVIQLGRSIFNQTKELDSLRFSMQSVIKSSVELADTQVFLSEVANNYGGDLLTLSERYIKFRAAAIQSNMSASETQKIFDSVSKAAGTLGLRTDELSGVYLAMEQMLSKGKITTEELRRQLGERLPGAFGIMATALGVTIPELDKMLKKGEILSAVALPKFAVALERAYGIENVKKIDTLAAAQGRMSTEFTKFAESLKMGDTFKGLINLFASSLRVLTEYSSVIKNVSKGLLLAAVAWSTYRMSVSLATAANTNAIWANKALTVSTRLQVIALSSATKAWNALKLAISTNPVGFILSAITTVAAALYLFAGRTKEVSQEIKDFTTETENAKNKVYELYNILGKTSTNSHLHKEALNQLNDISLKYNTTLQTENGLLDKNNTLHKQLKDNIEAQLKAKYRLEETDSANNERKKVLDPIRQKFIDRYKDEEDGYDKAILNYNEFIDLTNAKDPFSARTVAANKWGSLILPLLDRATKATKNYNEELLRIKTNYGEEPILLQPFELENIKNAKAEFEENERLSKLNLKRASDDQLALTDVYSVENGVRLKDFKEYLANLEKAASGYSNSMDIKKAIAFELNPEEKETKGGGGGSKGNEFTSLEKLKEANKKELELLKENQQELLDEFEGLESERLDIIKTNNIAILNERRKQIQEEMKLANAEQRGGLSTELAGIGADIASVETKSNRAINKQLNKEEIEDRKALADSVNQTTKDLEDHRKWLTDTTVNMLQKEVDETKLAAAEKAAFEIGMAKKTKDEIEKIRHEQRVSEIKAELKRYSDILGTKGLEADIYEWAAHKEREAQVAMLDETSSYKELVDDSDLQKTQAKMEAVNNFLQQGLEFSKQIYSAQAARAQEAYDTEMMAAGDSIEAQTEAKRKFEKEDKEIKRRQAIADKLQAVFNAGLNLALAISDPNLLLKPIKVAAAIIGLGMAVSAPIPQYFKGTKNAEGTFIAGEQGAELITKPDGTKLLTPDKPTLFSDASFKGSSILPADKTQAILQSYAVNGGSQVFVDMSRSEKYLSSMDKQMKNNEQRFVNTKGNTVVKRGNTTTILV